MSPEDFRFFVLVCLTALVGAVLGIGFAIDADLDQIAEAIRRQP